MMPRMKPQALTILANYSKFWKCLSRNHLIILTINIEIEKNIFEDFYVNFVCVQVKLVNYKFLRILKVLAFSR